jgi:hypothetical protein
MVTRTLRIGLICTTLASAVLVPTASASSPHRVKLPLVPLPKAALGVAGKSLALTHDSGVVSNAEAANNSTSGTTATFKNLGRVTGYDLTYGDPFTGGTGVTQIASAIEQYKSSAAAKKGLAFWRTDDAAQVTSLQQYGIGVTLKAVKVPALGASRFGYGTTFTFPNLAPIAGVDEQAVDGKYVLDVSVSGGSLSAASRLASKLLRTLDQRLQLAEKGRLRTNPVKLPPPLKAGPPAGGPDLSTLTLTTSDLTGTATILDQTYLVDSAALSAYVLDMKPAGQFQDLTQEIEWYPTANEATVVTSLEQAIVGSELRALLGVTPTVTPVDLTSIGDNAAGEILQFSANAQSVYVGMVGLARGQASDFVLFTSTSPLQPADVQGVAQAAATHLDAGVTG